MPGTAVRVVNSYAAASEWVPVSLVIRVDFPTDGKPAYTRCHCFWCFPSAHSLQGFSMHKHSAWAELTSNRHSENKMLLLCLYSTLDLCRRPESHLQSPLGHLPLYAHRIHAPHHLPRYLPPALTTPFSTWQSWPVFTSTDIVCWLPFPSV